jgi:hypothetical protein
MNDAPDVPAAPASAGVLIVPLVGLHFHPPAKHLLPGLPGGLALTLEPEPENPYDDHAILVRLDPTIVPVGLFPRLDFLIAGSGQTMAELCAAGEPLVLGHVGATEGKICLRLELPGNLEIEAMAASAGLGVVQLDAKLAFTPDGDPRVVVAPAGA